MLAAAAVVATAATIPAWTSTTARSASDLSSTTPTPTPEPTLPPMPTASPTPISPGATAAALAGDHWSELPAAPIPARSQAAATWTGRRMLVWGGANGADADHLRADGASYDPASSTWTTLPAAPISARTGMASVWTGADWFIWGGYDTLREGDLHVTADGALYDPASDNWRKLPPSPLPARANARALWVDGEVVVLGGQPAELSDDQHEYTDMAAYDPATNRWKKLAALPEPSNRNVLYIVATVANDEIYAWQEWQHVVTGDNESMTTSGIDLYVYDPGRNTWALDAAASRSPTGPEGNDAPVGIQEAIPAGGDIITPAAQLFCGFCPGPYTTGRRGGLLDVRANTWTALPHGPVDDLNPQSVWTGAALLAFNTGTWTSGPDGTQLPGEAAVWDPGNNSWTALPAAPLAAGSDATAVWAGDRLLEWGRMFVPADTGGGAAPVERDAGLSFGP